MNGDQAPLKNRTRRNWLASAAIAVLACSAEAGTTTALVADRLIDGRSKTALTDAVVLIDGERIVAIGNRSLIPAGAEVIELGDATLMPGMINAHEHPLMFEIGRAHV
jgi:imidazolonepropionase-like amidohydrolase